MTPQSISAAFELEVVMIPLDKLLPTRPVRETLRASTKYQTLLAAVREVGIVEPLNVFSQKGGKYLILDGHARVEALRDLGMTEAPCLKELSDEGHSYEKQVSRISPIQATRMILNAVDKGLPEERIAKTFNLDVKTVRGSRLLLKDICPEALDLLKDKQVAQATFRLLKKVKPLRQIEMAEIMVSGGSYSATYARALVVRTPKDQLVEPDSPHLIPGVKPEDLARMEHEIQSQEKDFRMLDETYTEQVMALTLARGYLRQLLDNNRVVKHLAKNFQEFLAEFQRIAESSVLEG